MKEIEVNFPCGEFSLEGVLSVPEGAGPFPAVIVCHPHPLYGGSMDNNVVSGICEALTRALLISFKFNFRGVGGSQGQFSNGVGEQADVAAAISYVSNTEIVDAQRIGLAGYSAGAGYACSVVAEGIGIKAFAAVSPPLDMFDFDSLRDYHGPKLLISGSRDDFTSGGNLLEFFRKLPEPKECLIIEGADHFWRGYESALVGNVVSFFTKSLKYGEGISAEF